MNRYLSFSLSSLTVAAILFSGCGEDRSTLYDSNGNKISFSGKKEIWIYDTREGRNMTAQNYVYIPGGFDVDGDGIDESGFWLAKYEARESNETISPLNMGTIRNAIRSSFLIYNPDTKRFDRQLDINDSSYLTSGLASIPEFHVNRVKFSEEGNATGSYSPVEAAMAMVFSQVEDVPWRLSLPSEKQWMQIVKLVINNKENWTSEKIGEGKIYRGERYNSDSRRYFIIANNILGNDPHVPEDYRVRVYDLSGGHAEWTKGMFAINDRFLGGNAGLNEYTTLGNNVPKWWMPILEGEEQPLHSIYGAGMYFDGANTSGATDTINLTGVTGDVDPYAVVARGGSAARGDEDLTGVSAAKLSYGPGFKDPSIGFRGASEYVE